MFWNYPDIMNRVKFMLTSYLLETPSMTAYAYCPNVENKFLDHIQIFLALFFMASHSSNNGKQFEGQQI